MVGSDRSEDPATLRTSGCPSRTLREPNPGSTGFTKPYLACKIPMKW